MIDRRTLAFAIATVVVAFGGAATLVPGLVDGFDVVTLLVGGVWLIALGQLLVGVTDRLDTGHSREQPLPRTGERPDYPVPGDELARSVESVGVTGPDRAERDRIRERLRAAADAVSTPHEKQGRDGDGWREDDRPESVLHVEEGDAPGRPDTEPAFQERAQRVATAIARRRRRSGES